MRVNVDATARSVRAESREEASRPRHRHRDQHERLARPEFRPVDVPPRAPTAGSDWVIMRVNAEATVRSVRAECCEEAFRPCHRRRAQHGRVARPELRHGTCSVFSTVFDEYLFCRMCDNLRAFAFRY